MKLRKYKDFVLFWVAMTTSVFGNYITSLALQVLIVVNMGGSTIDVGWVSASRWLPYVFLGLIAGVIIDQINRKFVLVVTDLGRGILLMLVCLMAIYDVISVGWLIVMMVLFGAMSLFNDAVYQSFLPQIVPRSLLTRANARLEQSSAVAETSGPAVAGGFISWIGAPFAILMDAVSYIFSGLLTLFIKYKPQEKGSAAPLNKKISEGLGWVYHHQYLRPLALNTHAWFLFHSMTRTILVPFAIIELGFKASTLGFVLAAAGVGALLGTSLSIRASQRWGIGRAMTFSRVLYIPALILVVLAPSEFQIKTLIMVVMGQLIYGFAMGIEGPLEMGFQQYITPSFLQGRMNATKRSINRSMFVIGAPLGGTIADVLGFGPALWISIIGLTICGIWFRFSPMWHARLENEEEIHSFR